MPENKKCECCDENTAVCACAHCGKGICEDCLAPVTQHGFVDYNLCIVCYDARNIGS